MQRKAIKIGMLVGVVPKFSKSADHDAHGPAEVVATNGEYTHYRSGGFSRLGSGMKDGIVVTFNHDVVEDYRRFRAAKPGETAEKNGGGYGAKFIPLGTPVVLESPKLVIGEWAPIAAMHKRWADEKQHTLDVIDAEGDKYEARFEAIVAALAERGIEDTGAFDTPLRVRSDERRGNNGHRIVGATWTLTSATIEALLGIEGSA